MEDSFETGGRNLRAKTIQASMVTRSRALGVVNGPAMGYGSNQDPKKAIGDNTGSGKENMVPQGPPVIKANDSGNTNNNNNNQKSEQPWDDLDLEDAGDPLMVSEYVIDIMDYMRSIEVSPYFLFTNLLTHKPTH